ncbi:MAG: hypothetical protein KDA93_09535 [Planctomycetaceae bacterium]|nr:hypothetical protein [Planctomycetaceae bacterium]
MPRPTDCWRLSRYLILSVCASLMLPGCSDDSASGYQSYQEVQASDGSGDDILPDGDGSSETPDRQPTDETVSLDIEDVETNPGQLDVATTGGDAGSNDLRATESQTADQEEKTSPPPTAAGTNEDDPLLPELADDPESGDRDDLPPGEANLQTQLDEPIEPREITLLIPEKSFTPEGSEGVLRVSYDDVNLLDILNMDPVPPNAEEHFPSWLAELAGKRIRIRGFMYPPFQSTGLPMFVLVRDNQECCFGPGAKIYDHILVNMRDGVTTDYIQGRAFDVEGTFDILPEADGDELYQLYVLKDALVIEK